jgi:glycerophosphoryl diester phosphodiesterase
MLAKRALIAIGLFSAFAMTTPTTARAAEIVAHRGASFDAPENTVAAMKEGIRQGADALETDFWLTKDNRIIVNHDATTKRTTGVDLKIAETSFDELRKLDAGKWKAPQFAGEKLPTLEEILACVPAGKKVLLEIKCGPEIVPFMKKGIEASSLKPEQIRIISFKEDVIAASKKAMPNIKAYWLFNYKQDKDGKWNSTQEEVLSTLKRVNADGLDIQLAKATQEKINRDLASKLRAMGMEFHVWTVDEPELAKYAVELGVDSITTNKPAFIREQLKK